MADDIGVDQAFPTRPVPAPLTSAAKTGMRDLHKLLVLLAPHLDLLFPEGILANDQGPDSLCDQQIDDTTAGRMQIVQDKAVALRRDAIKLTRSEAVRLGKLLLAVFALLVVQVVHGFYRTPVDQAGDEIGFVLR
jgi:hypothetical protein